MRSLIDGGADTGAGVLGLAAADDNGDGWGDDEDDEDWGDLEDGDTGGNEAWDDFDVEPAKPSVAARDRAKEEREQRRLERLREREARKKNQQTLGGTAWDGGAEGTMKATTGKGLGLGSKSSSGGSGSGGGMKLTRKKKGLGGLKKAD